ncbi:inosamine-phosphate amidinotransferase 1 [Streptomyces lavendulocolor]|uniref:inosamine-phosphate amidinotransferase 1 n=1 Tax=Streptomyces lavendulocolor TaxID=67316 RepID=UPI003C30B18B
MSLVSVHNEWDPLEEVVIGTALGARVPVADRSLLTVEYTAHTASPGHAGGPRCSGRPGPAVARRRPGVLPGPYPDRVLKETEAELEELCEELRGLGVTVRRPRARDRAAPGRTSDCGSGGYHDLCPRDGLLTVGDTVIETPMALRARFLEPLAYRELLTEYLTSGSRWISAPKPRLADAMYDPGAPPGERLRELEPVFDAANVLRLGTDLLYLVSDSGNALGARWLQSALGGVYTVHPCHGLSASPHPDSTLVPLRPGLVLVDPSRVSDGNLPAVLRSWERIECPGPVGLGHPGEALHSSPWTGMSLLVVRPGLVVADGRQRELMRVLERHGVDVLPLRLTHARMLGGGLHGVALDVRRTGVLETYRF